MKLIEFARLHLKLVIKLYFFVVFLFLLQIILSYIFVYKSSLAQIENRLNTLTMRIDKDLIYDGKTWNTSLYNSDPLTPYPNGSSGFLNPLYIVTKEGFIIERSTPIKGLLDTSDFKHLLQFQEPQTIDTVTNEKWRVISKPLAMEGKTLGVVVVSYYNPQEGEIPLIDKKIQESLLFIISQLDLSKNKIDISKLDIRNIHYEFSFEVVDIYNNVLANNGRVPTFIDASYFAREVEAHPYRIIKDKKTGEQYMVVSRIIGGENLEPVGIITAGESVRSLYTILHNYVLFALLISTLCIIPLLVYVVHIFRTDVMMLIAGKPNQETQKSIFHISFDKKGSFIKIDSDKYEIPYASNQFYVCDAIFSAPTKRWEYDQLLEKLGDTNDDDINNRKVYDAVLAINKKCGLKIIEYKNKVFIMNPIYLSSLSKK